MRTAVTQISLRVDSPVHQVVSENEIIYGPRITRSTTGMHYLTTLEHRVVSNAHSLPVRGPKEVWPLSKNWIRPRIAIHQVITHYYVRRLHRQSLIVF